MSNRRTSAPPTNGNFELRHWRAVAMGSGSSRKASFRPSNIAIPDMLDLPSGAAAAAAANGDFELRYWQGETGYTSIRDLLSSPKAAYLNSPSAGEIQIKNRLVKHAAFAYAYLQPTPSSTDSSRRRRFSFRRALGSCFGFLHRILLGFRIRK